MQEQNNEMANRVTGAVLFDNLKRGGLTIAVRIRNSQLDLPWENHYWNIKVTHVQAPNAIWATIDNNDVCIEFRTLSAKMPTFSLSLTLLREKKSSISHYSIVTDNKSKMGAHTLEKLFVQHRIHSIGWQKQSIYPH